MEFKKLSFALLTASILSACGGGDSSSDNSTTDSSGNGDGSVGPNSCMTIASEQLCVSSEFAAQSGDRLYIPITGNIPDSVELTWGITDSGDLKAPVFSEVSKGAYVIAPVTGSGGNLKVEIRGETDDRTEEGTISTILKVAGGDNLTLNGINTITVDESSLMTVEWLAATDSAGNLASNPEYTLTVTRLIDGEPSNDIDTLTTLTTAESISVLAGETYRLDLSVKSDSGAITYSEHYDYVVADNLPELANYVSDSNPDANSYDEGQLIDQDGTFMIVRETEDGEKAIVEAEEYELYSPDAPLVVSLRVKDIDDEDLTALSSTFSTYTSGHQNSFTVSAQEDAYSTFAKSSDPKKCYSKSVSGLNASACAPYDKISVICEARFELSSSPTANASCRFAGTVNVTARASTKDLTFDVMWPFPKIEKSIKGTKLAIAPNVGLKTLFSMPLSVYTDFDVNSSVNTNGNLSFSRTYKPSFDLIAKASTRVVPKDGKFFHVELGTDKSNDEINVKFRARLGAFPNIQLGNGLKANLEGAGEVLATADYVPLQDGLTNASIPLVSTVDADIDTKAYATASVKVTKFKTWPLTKLNIDDSWNWETPTWSLYSHPEKIIIKVNESRQCVGSTRYTNTEAPVYLPEYGELNVGGHYGYGFKNVDSYEYSGGLRLMSATSLDSTAKIANVSYNSVIVEYEDKPAFSDRKAKILYSFQNTNSPLGAFFPTYGLDEVWTRWSSTMEYPWVCWGKGYDKEEETFTASVSLTELAKMIED